MTDAPIDRRALALQARLSERGIPIEPREMDASTHTAQQAADALGCGVAAIVKSLLFEADGEPLLVLASGPNRVDTALLGALLGTPVTMADAKRVKAVTGSSIGGVPPLGHPEALRTIMDETLHQLLEQDVAAQLGDPQVELPVPFAEDLDPGALALFRHGQPVPREFEQFLTLR